MISKPASPTFAQMVENIAVEDPFALVLGWWRRVERTLTYYTIAFHSPKPQTAAESIRQLAADGRVDQVSIDRLNKLRVTRNAVAHGTAAILPNDAVQYSIDALDLIWIIGATVPNARALSSGAAEYA